jgi:hypothetical protein
MLSNQNEDPKLLEEAKALDEEASQLRDIGSAELSKLLSDSAVLPKPVANVRIQGEGSVHSMSVLHQQVASPGRQPSSPTVVIVSPEGYRPPSSTGQFEPFKMTSSGSTFMKFGYMCIFFHIPTIHNRRVKQLLNAASSCCSELEIRMDSAHPLSDSTPTVSRAAALHDLTQDEWDDLIPKDLPTSALLPASRKFYELWNELVEVLTYEWGLVMTASAAIIASARVSLLSFTTVLTHSQINMDNVSNYKRFR